MYESLRTPQHVTQITDRELNLEEQNGRKALAQLFRQQMDQMLGDENYRSFDFEGVFDVWQRSRYRTLDGSLLYSQDWPDPILSGYPGTVVLSRKPKLYDIRVSIWPGLGVNFTLKDDKPILSITKGTKYGKETVPIKDKRLRSQMQQLKYGIFLAARLHDAFIEPETILR